MTSTINESVDVGMSLAFSRFVPHATSTKKGKINSSFFIVAMDLYVNYSIGSSKSDRIMFFLLQWEVHLQFGQDFAIIVH